MSQREKFIEAIQCAKNIISFCGADSYEMECTLDDRSRFNELYKELIPKEKPNDDFCKIDCPKCGKKYYDFALKSHIKGAHGVRCSKCNKPFASEKDLENHTKMFKHAGE